MLQSIQQKLRTKEEYFYARIQMIWKNERRLVEVFFLSLVFFLVLSQLPYLKVYFGLSGALVMVVLTAKLLFHFHVRYIIYLCILLFAPAVLLSITGRNDSAETIGNVIYIFLWVSVILYLKDLLKELWNTQKR